MSVCIMWGGGGGAWGGGMCVCTCGWVGEYMGGHVCDCVCVCVCARIRVCMRAGGGLVCPILLWYNIWGPV